MRDAVVIVTLILAVLVIGILSIPAGDPASPAPDLPLEQRFDLDHRAPGPGAVERAPAGTIKIDPRCITEPNRPGC